MMLSIHTDTAALVSNKISRRDVGPLKVNSNATTFQQTGRWVGPRTDANLAAKRVVSTRNLTQQSDILRIYLSAHGNLNLCRE
jgi:hypothetical protein